MNLSAWLIATALLISVVVLPVAGQALGDGSTHDGFVVTAGAGKLTMSGADGKQHTHEIGEAVKITVHGKVAKLDDLKKGMRVRVTTDKDGKVLTVGTVDAEKS